MMVSTKGRYALRVMIDLAENGKERFVPLKDISERQQLSQKYLESIMVLFSKAGMVTGQHGKGGGYRLVRAPEEYTVGSILRTAEGKLSPVACLENGQCICPNAEGCRTLPLWTELERMIDDYLEQHTLAELIEQSQGGNTVGACLAERGN